MGDASTQGSGRGGPDRALAAAVRSVHEGGSLAVRRTEDDTLVALFRRRGSTTQVRAMNLGRLPQHLPAGCTCRVTTCGRTRVDGPRSRELVGGIACLRHALDWCVWLVALHRGRRPGEDLWLTAVTPGTGASTTLLSMETEGAVPVAPTARVPRQARRVEGPACLTLAPKVTVLPPREKPRDERYYLWGWATDSK